MPRKFNISITYVPKIAPVREGTCKQTIRTLPDHKCKCKGKDLGFWKHRESEHHSSGSKKICPKCRGTGIIKAIPKRQGDLVAFHGWSGKPYDSPWSWRTPYMEITRAFDCTIFPSGIYIPENQPFALEVETGSLNWIFLDWLARLDGIVPATGQELGRVLMEKNPIPAEGIRAQIIRWK